MRKLYIRRERALACFAIPYHCVVDEPMAEHLRRIETLDRRTLMLSHDENTVRNGETICLAHDETAGSLFVIAYREHDVLATETLPIPAGDGDLRFTVTTQYDGDRRLSLSLSAERAQEQN